MQNKKLPKGWKEVELGDILDYEQPTEYIVSSDEYDDKNKTPVLTAGKSFILGYTDEKEGIYNKLPVIIFDDFTTAIKFVTFPFKVKSSAMKFLRPKNKDVDLKYIFWLMQTIKVNSVSHKRYYLSKYQYLKIHLPPLPIQQKIVSILEKAEKAKEMRKEADELTKEFLRSVFMEMFKDPTINLNKLQKKPLREFGEIITGNTPSRAVSKYYGDYMEWIKSDNLNTPYTFLTKSEEMLSQEGVKIGRIVPKGSVLVTCIAGSLSCIGNAAIADRQVAFNQQINAIVPNNKVNSFYLYYLIINSKKIIQDSSTQSMKGMVSKSVFVSILLPLPPIELQNKFASIVKEIEQIKDQQKQSKEQIDILFNVLMQKAFKGELIK